MFRAKQQGDTRGRNLTYKPPVNPVPELTREHTDTKDTSPDIQIRTPPQMYSHITAHDTGSSRPVKRPPFDQLITPSGRQNTGAL